MKHLPCCVGAMLYGLVVTLGCLSAAPGEAAPGLRAVWAVDDGEKVFQDDLDHPLKSGGAGNSVWDGTTVHLFAARNEIVAFQLILEADAAGASQVDVHVSDLVNGAASIRGSHPLPAPNDYLGVGVELFTEHYLNITTPSWNSPCGGFYWTGEANPHITGKIPDALVPFSALPGKGGTPFAIGANLNQGVWADIYVPRDGAPGTYSGTITVSVQGSPVAAIPLEVEVFDITLPDENHYKSMVFYSRGSILERHNTDYCTPEMWEMVLNYHRMAHRHRLELIGCGDWTETEPLKGTLTGEAFTAAHNYDGPGEGVGNSLFAVNTYGVQFPDDEASYRTESDSWVNWFTANAPADIEYFLYLCDEPGPDMYPWIQERASWIHNNPGPGHNLPVFMTRAPIDSLVGSIDIWCCQAPSYYPEDVAAAQARGERVWLYAGNRPKTPADATDEYGIAFRLKPWIAYYCGIARWFTWESTHYYNNRNEIDPDGRKNVWVNPITFSEDMGGGVPCPAGTGNGDGVLFYPGQDALFPEEDRDYPGPVSSIRMKMYRRGAQDYEYMWLAAQAGHGADVQSLLDGALPHVMWDAVSVPDWSNTNADYEAIRRQLAELVATDHTVTVSAQAEPAVVASAGTTRLTSTAIDSHAHGIASWSWIDGAAGGSFSPSALVQNPTYTASANTTANNRTVTLTATATCDGPTPLTSSGSTTLTVQGVAPSGLTATAVSATQINLAWRDNTTGETGFKIERKTGASGTYIQIGTVAANVVSYASTGLTPNTLYYYRVRAYATGNSAYSNEASATTLIVNAPSSLTATAVSAVQINLAWTDNSSNETGFKIERKTGASGTYAQIATVAANVVTYQNTGLTGNTLYYYRVRSYTAAGNSPYTNEASATTPIVNAPTALTATTISISQINLAWTDNSTNETGFKIERKTGASGSYTQVGAMPANVASYQNTGLTANTLYYYRVRAYTAAGNSPYSNEASATTFIVNPPTTLTATVASTSQINLAWRDNASNETGFKIERKTGATGTYAQIATVAANVVSYQNTGLTANTLYYYRVRAYNATGNSPYTNEASGTTFLVNPPSTLTATVTSTSQIKLTWRDNATNETGFKIERKTGATGTYAQIATVGANVVTYTNSGLAANTKYYYRVRAYNATGNSPYSNEVYGTTFLINPPGTLAATALSRSQIKLTWRDNATNESGFKIERKTGATGTYAQIATVGANVVTYTNSGLAANTTYYYRVRAYNGSGNSPYSNEANAKTPS